MPFCLLAACLLVACATPLSEQIKRVQVGMEKDQVLLITGAPSRYRRVKTRDVYTYFFYEDDVRLEREIQFEAGRVVYVGEVSKPTETAEEADERIRRENEAADAEAEKRKQERKDLPQKLEEELKGKPEELTIPTYKEI